MPEANPANELLVCNGEPLIENLTGAVPPEADTVAVPLFPPLQEGGVVEDDVIIGPGWFPTTNGTEAVHPRVSVIVTL